jgi:hypothetical protein
MYTKSKAPRNPSFNFSTSTFRVQRLGTFLNITVVYSEVWVSSAQEKGAGLAQAPAGTEEPDKNTFMGMSAPTSKVPVVWSAIGHSSSVWLLPLQEKSLAPSSVEDQPCESTSGASAANFFRSGLCKPFSESDPDASD